MVALLVHSQAPAGFCLATELKGTLGGCSQPFSRRHTLVTIDFSASAGSPGTAAATPAAVSTQLAAGALTARPAAGLPPPPRLSLRSIIFVLVAGSLLAPLFLVVTPSGVLPRHPSELATRRDAVRAAQEFASSVLSIPLPQAFLACESDSSRTVVVPLLLGSLEPRLQSFLDGAVALDASFAWRSWTDIVGPPATHCAAALTILSAVTARPLPVPPRPVFLAPPPPKNRGPDLARIARWDRQLELVERGESLLRERLLLTSASGLGWAFLRNWADRVASGPRDQHLPLALRDSDDSSDVGLRGRPFSARFTPVHTVPLAAPAPQTDSGFRPRGISDILEPQAIARLHAFLSIQASNLAAIRRFGSAVQRADDALATRGFGQAVQRLVPLVIGQDEFLPLARGVVWDCRDIESMGHCSPLDPALPPNSDLNSAYILQQFGPAGVSPWPDQELVSQVVNGVQFRAHMPLQIVMLPHLVSLPLGFASVDKEVTDFLERGWYQRTLGLPFLPLRAMGQGAAARKSDPSRFRRTTDGGGPRKPACDRVGIPAVSFNDAIGLHDTVTPSDAEFDASHGTPRSPKWPAPEIKPRIEDLMHDIAILRHTHCVECVQGTTGGFHG